MLGTMSDELPAANAQDVRMAISYALRFGDTGKPHRTAMDDMAHLAADIIARHLERCGYVILKRPGLPLQPTVFKGQLPLSRSCVSTSVWAPVWSATHASPVSHCKKT